MPGPPGIRGTRKPPLLGTEVTGTADQPCGSGAEVKFGAVQTVIAGAGAGSGGNGWKDGRMCAQKDPTTLGQLWQDLYSSWHQ